jgi:hypothetical protein
MSRNHSGAEPLFWPRRKLPATCTPPSAAPYDQVDAVTRAALVPADERAPLVSGVQKLATHVNGTRHAGQPLVQRADGPAGRWFWGGRQRRLRHGRPRSSGAQGPRAIWAAARPCASSPKPSKGAHRICMSVGDHQRDPRCPAASRRRPGSRQQNTRCAARVCQSPSCGRGDGGSGVDGGSRGWVGVMPLLGGLRPPLPACPQCRRSRRARGSGRRTGKRRAAGRRRACAGVCARALVHASGACARSGGGGPWRFAARLL